MTLIPEGMVDKRINQVTRYVGDSDLGVKLACIAASNVVGTYDGTTQEIAKRTRRSVSTVQNWAHAHWMYKEARKSDMQLARLLWRKLPPTHFWRAWDIHQAGYDAMYYLLAAFQNDWSSKGMMGEWDKERLAGHAPLQYKRAVIALRGLAEELLKRVNNEAQKVALLSVLDVFK
jgi:hypothetical protein